jgi:hypothetical protein
VVNNSPYQNQETTVAAAASPQPRRTTRSLWLGREYGWMVWLLLLVFGMMLLLWNWQLIAATIAGILVMVAMYAIQDGNWSIFLWRIHRFLQSPYRHLTLSVASGTLTVMLTYTVLALWSTQENHWLASASILQLVGTLGAVVLLLRQSFQQWFQRQQNNFDQLISQLTAKDDLARLMAIKHINQYVKDNYLPAAQEEAIADYCQLLLSRETDSTMREALFSTLESLAPMAVNPILNKSVNPTVQSDH